MFSDHQGLECSVKIDSRILKEHCTRASGLPRSASEEIWKTYYDWFRSKRKSQEVSSVIGFKAGIPTTLFRQLVE